MDNSVETYQWRTDPREVASVVEQLLDPAHSALLEQFRFVGSTNRVYRIPIGPGNEFVILKLLPNRFFSLTYWAKRAIRNGLYGERMGGTGRKRALMEIERVEEWQEEGFLVPPHIRVDHPEARVFRGIDLPTFYTVLSDDSYSRAQRLRALGVVTASLFVQHERAVKKDRASLLHKDPGPWNVMVDLNRGLAWWFDLEHARNYPSMTIDALIRRSLRIFIFGVMDHFKDDISDVAETIVANYPDQGRLHDLISHIMERRRSIRGRVLISLLPKTRSRVERLIEEFAPAVRNVTVAS